MHALEVVINCKLGSTYAITHTTKTSSQSMTNVKEMAN